MKALQSEELLKMHLFFKMKLRIQVIIIGMKCTSDDYQRGFTLSPDMQSTISVFILIKYA
ncbi:hypothetical protein [Lederbergia lenta]|uniref:Uncharacterized protein n=1 Tax=Lederbergia lenta TaxID=1467 RepID=A0A2X4WVP4_LEDLE|nr:hypothetical protein [Lederbergia lenta]MCM3111888.1 hypothetical protein [Lederbergia lenta]MEC2323042.1 hypothetical protein [Lederbergia lenta]SQI62542.1 Uncharacterised protein [Lederbergia lenta]